MRKFLCLLLLFNSSLAVACTNYTQQEERASNIILMSEDSGLDKKNLYEIYVFYSYLASMMIDIQVIDVYQFLVAGYPATKESVGEFLIGYLDKLQTEYIALAEEDKQIVSKVYKDKLGISYLGFIRALNSSDTIKNVYNKVLVDDKINKDEILQKIFLDKKSFDRKKAENINCQG